MSCSEPGDVADVATDARMACVDRYVRWRPVSKRDRFAGACLAMAHRPGSSHQARHSVLRVERESKAAREDSLEKANAVAQGATVDGFFPCGCLLKRDSKGEAKSENCETG